MLAVALAGHRVGFEYPLHYVEGELVGQPLMATVGIFCAAVADRADVVGIDQEAGELGPRQGTAALLGGAPGPQAASLKFGAERVQRVVAGGVRRERPGDVWGALGVRFDRGDVAARRLVALLDVEIADWRRSRRPAEFCLAVETALHFFGQNLGIELGIGGGVAAHPFTERRLVEMLHRRDDVDAQLLQFGGQHDVVIGVASEARDFVYEDEV